MRYAPLHSVDWNPEDEGYSDDAIAIVMLNDDNTVAEDELLRGRSNMRAGVAVVYNADGFRHEGYIWVPLDIVIHNEYTFSTVDDALNWVMRLRLRDTDDEVLEGYINQELRINRGIDQLIEEQRVRNKLILFIAIMGFIFIILIFYIIFTGQFPPKVVIPASVV